VDDVHRRTATHDVMVVAGGSHVVMLHLTELEEMRDQEQEREHGHEAGCWVEEPGGARHRRHRA
jgi:hypothetical protein